MSPRPTPTETSIPAIKAPPPVRDNPLTRSLAGVLGLGFLGLMLLLCLGTLPYTLGSVSDVAGSQASTPRYNAGQPREGRIPPAFWPKDDQAILRLNSAVPASTIEQVAAELDMAPAAVIAQTEGPAADALREHWPTPILGTDVLGRSLLVRSLTGGGISLGIGIAAALISVFIGTLYGSIAAYMGGRVDAVMMRVVDILYGLPYILLVVLLAVAGDALVEQYIANTGTDLSRLQRSLIDVGILLVAIGGVSWLTMARVIRGQVLSLKARPFVEAARAVGAPGRRIFFRHLLPNVLGPVIVYATLTVPQAILQESFLSFLGIGVKPPLPSWGNLAAEGLGELNTFRSNWWLLFFPCLLLGTTLLALNFVGEGLREALDPRRARR